MKMFPSPQGPEPEIPPVDNMFAPEVLCSGVAGLSLINGILTVTVESVRCDHTKTPPPLERVVVARFALPIPAAQRLLLGMHQLLGQHGLNLLPGTAETRQ